MRGAKSKQFVDPELLRIVFSARADESLPVENGTLWCYRVGSYLLGLKNEHEPEPEIVFCHRFDSAEEATSALQYLRDARGRAKESVAAQLISEEQSVSPDALETVEVNVETCKNVRIMGIEPNISTVQAAEEERECQ